MKGELWILQTATLSDTLWEAQRIWMTGAPLCRRKRSTTHVHIHVHIHVHYTGRCDWCGERRSCSSFQLFLVVSNFSNLYILCFIKIFLATYGIKPRALHRTRHALYHCPTFQVLCLSFLEGKLLLLKRITSLQKAENLLWKSPKGDR